MKFLTQITLILFILTANFINECGESATTSAPELSRRGQARNSAKNLKKTKSYEDRGSSDETLEHGVKTRLPKPDDPLIPLEKPIKQDAPKRNLKCNDKLMEIAQKFDEDNEFPNYGLKEIQRIWSVYNNLRHKTKTFYVYLLLRGSEIGNVEKLTFSNFLAAVFYAGKGTERRITHHLRETIKSPLYPPSDISPAQAYYKSSTPFPQTSSKSEEKVAAIKQQWDTGNGVYLYKFVDLIHEEEAFVIKAYGAEHLTNKVAGHGFCRAFPEVKEWLDDSEMTAQIGSRILYNAYESFKLQRLRPFYMHDAGVLVY